MGFSIRSSRLASVGLASVIAVGVIGVGSVALADDGSGSTVEEHARHRKPIVAGLHALLDGSGVTKDEIQEGAAAGLTLGQIIDQYGDISADAAKAGALEKLGTKLDEAVAADKLTQAQADAIEARAPTAFDKLLSTVPGEHRGDRPHAGKARAIAKHSLETVSEVLGIDVATLRERLMAGETVAEIAGPQAKAVIDALVAQANTAIERAVAAGKLPADKEAQAQERAAAAIERWVNEGGPKHRAP